MLRQHNTSFLGHRYSVIYSYNFIRKGKRSRINKSALLLNRHKDMIYTKCELKFTNLADVLHFKSTNCKINKKMIGGLQYA